MRTSSNHRDDAYGGSAENRTRLIGEVLDALLTVWEPGRVGIRFSPCSHAGGERTATSEQLARLHAAFSGTYMGNNGYDREMAMQAIDDGDAELVCVGRQFISNPDLVERLQRDATLNELDPDTLYGGGAEGCTDFRFCMRRLPEADQQDNKETLHDSCSCYHQNQAR